MHLGRVTGVLLCFTEITVTVLHTLNQYTNTFFSISTLVVQIFVSLKCYCTVSVCLLSSAFSVNTKVNGRFDEIIAQVAFLYANSDLKRLVRKEKNYVQYCDSAGENQVFFLFVIVVVVVEKIRFQQN